MKKGMNNLSLLLGVAVASQVSSAVTVDLKPGVLGYRTITKDEFGEKPNSFEPGASIGLEIMSGKPEDGFRWGLGSEYQTELNGKRGYKAFSSVPVVSIFVVVPSCPTSSVGSCTGTTKVRTLFFC